MRISDWSSDVCSTDLVPVGEADAAMALGALDRLRRAGAVDAVIFLGQVDPDDADRTVGAWRDALLVLLVGHIPEELGLEMEGRIIGDAGHPPVAQRQRDRKSTRLNSSH